MDNSKAIYDDLMKQLDYSQSSFSQEDPCGLASRQESSVSQLQTLSINGQQYVPMEQLHKLGVDPRLLSSSNRAKVKQYSDSALADTDNKVVAADAGSKNTEEIVDWQEHMEKAGEISENSPASPKVEKEVVVAIDGLETAVVPCVLQFRQAEYNAEMCTQEQHFGSQLEWAEEKSAGDVDITDQNSQVKDSSMINCHYTDNLPKNTASNAINPKVEDGAPPQEYDYRANQSIKEQLNNDENKAVKSNNSDGNKIQSQVQIQSNSSEISASQSIDQHDNINSYLTPILASKITVFLQSRLEHLHALSMQPDEDDASNEQFKKSTEEFFTVTLASSIAHLQSSHAISCTFKTQEELARDDGKTAEQIEGILADFILKNKLLKSKSKGKTKTLILMILLERYHLLSEPAAQQTKVTAQNGSTTPASGKQGDPADESNGKSKIKELRLRKQIQRLDKQIKETLNQMQLMVSIQQLGGSSTIPAEGKSAEQEFEDTLRWSILAIFGEKLQSFLHDMFQELQIGSEAFIKELRGLAKKVKKPARRMTTQCGTSVLQDRSASGRRTPTRAAFLDDGGKSPGSSRKKKQTSTQKKLNSVEPLADMPMLPSTASGVACPKRDSDLKLFGKPSPLPSKNEDKGNDVQKVDMTSMWQAPFQSNALDNLDLMFDANGQDAVGTLQTNGVFNQTQTNCGGLETLLKANGTRSTADDDAEDLFHNLQPPKKRQRIEKLRSVVIEHHLNNTSRIDPNKNGQTTMPDLFKQNSEVMANDKKPSSSSLVLNSLPSATPSLAAQAPASSIGTPLMGAPSKMGFSCMNRQRKPAAATRRKFQTSMIKTQKPRDNQLITTPGCQITSSNMSKQQTIAPPSKGTSIVNELLKVDSRIGRKAVQQGSLIQRYKSKKQASKIDANCKQDEYRQAQLKQQQVGKTEAFMRDEMKHFGF